jgi:hypothetical protein
MRWRKRLDYERPVAVSLAPGQVPPPPPSPRMRTEPTLAERDPVLARMVIEQVLADLDRLVERDRFGRECGA